MSSVRLIPAYAKRRATHTRPQTDTPGLARSERQGDVKAGGSDPPAMGSGWVWGRAAGVLGVPWGLIWGFRSCYLWFVNLQVTNSVVI